LNTPLIFFHFSGYKPGSEYYTGRINDPIYALKNRPDIIPLFNEYNKALKENDFVILDFEGEPESTIRDRKIKQPPLKDLAGLFRSFHYALFASILNNPDKLSYKQEHLFEAGEKLFTYVVAVCMDAYLQRIYSFGELNIGYKKEQEFILMYHMTEKAIYELGYELNSRPDWAIIPLKGIASILKTEI
jgi:maltose alpha-D-glucosyltransferase/alpha-amylase